jgi:hypothetical protein
VHIKTEYDYRFICDRKDDVIEILKKRHAEIKNQNIPVFGVPKGNLRYVIIFNIFIKRLHNN